MPCFGCMQTRQAFFTSIYAGNARGVASAVRQAVQINVDKVKQAAPNFIDRRGARQEGARARRPSLRHSSSL